MNYVTPGVIVEEITTFPPSVVAAETAVPAFIGYTERALDRDGASLLRVPTRITSLLDFEVWFGGAFVPSTYAMQLDTASGNALGTVTPRDSSNSERRYHLYNALRHYFANGGGPCYIVAVGLYPAQVVLGTDTTGLRGGLNALRNADEPTLLVYPDAVNLTAPELGSLQRQALDQCFELRDRFTIMDLASGSAAPVIGADPANDFRQNIGTGNLQYGAAYYPWLNSIYRPDVHFRDIAFVDTANTNIGEAYINTIGSPAENALLAELRKANTASDAVVSAVNVAAWSNSPVKLTRRNFRDLSAHYKTLTAAVRGTTVPPIADLRQTFGNLVLLPRALALALNMLRDTTLNLAELRRTFANVFVLSRGLALGLEALRADGTLPPALATKVGALATDTKVVAAVRGLVGLEKHAEVRNLVAAGRTLANVEAAYAALNTSPMISPDAAVATIPVSGAAIFHPDRVVTARNAIAELTPIFERLAQAMLDAFQVARELGAGADAAMDKIVGTVNVAGWNNSPVTLTRQSFPELAAHQAALTAAVRSVPVPPAAQVVASLVTDVAVRDAVRSVIALEKHASVLTLVAQGRTEALVSTDYQALDGSPWILPAADAAGVAASTDANIYNAASQVTTAVNTAIAMAPAFERLATAVLAVFDAAEHLAEGAEAQLFAGHTLFAAVRERIQREMALVPPSGAVTGAYAAVDRARGVWKAPANVPIADLVGPAVKVNDATQGRFNVHSSGKSINVLRAFANMGTLVWGARTLAGNDNEWRYVNVRRFFNMAEEAIQTATEPFVFEPNVANTWVRVKAMIENFLTVQWRLGALTGATTQQAYYVKIGLGETMTAQEILEGKMVVEVGMAVVRPAEFIILRFAHKMQVS